MLITPDDQAQIIAAINQRFTPGGAMCPLCHHRNWTLLDGYVMLPLQPSPTDAYYLGGSSYAPSVGIVCSHCGNTQVLNLVALGLPELAHQQNPDLPYMSSWEAPSGAAYVSANALETILARIRDRRARAAGSAAIRTTESPEPKKK